jgi:hypothetical protein
MNPGDPWLGLLGESGPGTWLDRGAGKFLSHFSPLEADN